ncbi:hypothetical protein Vretifemale_4240, partial [Volvox reticuliferus]
AAWAAPPEPSAAGGRGRGKKPAFLASAPDVHHVPAPPDSRFELLPLRRQEPFLRNSPTCSYCQKTYHEELSPLCLCDYCPRAYHLACLDMEYEELRLLDWACPRCAERLEMSGANGGAAGYLCVPPPPALPSTLGLGGGATTPSAAAAATVSGLGPDALVALRRNMRWADPADKAAYLAARAAQRAAEREERE